MGRRTLLPIQEGHLLAVPSLLDAPMLDLMCSHFVLALVARQGNSFRLHTLALSSPGSQPVALTDTVDDESPSFAPNGKLIIYATRAGGRSPW